ncbi:hypothetical protein NYE54_12850 [Paenibacillus sp. FSL K6-1330]|uniref:hypothetical protein n=1 Tax=Paenibacillus sp. FSL K6-1330 TaxID=2975292 RepID=UPI0030D9EB5C
MQVTNRPGGFINLLDHHDRHHRMGSMDFIPSIYGVAIRSKGLVPVMVMHFVMNVLFVLSGMILSLSKGRR